MYYLLQSKTSDERDTLDNLYSFVAAKKGIALVLLASFIIMGLHTLYGTLTGNQQGDFFHDFYTLLIITDILVVLVAQCFHPSFYSIFRNSGFALSTMIIRLALVAPVYFNVLLGLAAIILAILLTVISDRLFSTSKEVHSKH